MLVTVIFAGWLLFSEGGLSQLDNIFGPQKSVFYRTVATVSGAMVGFTMTVAALVLSRVAMERFQMFRSGRSGKNYETLCKTYAQAVKSLGALTLASVAALVFDTKDSPCHLAMVPVVFLMLLSFFRITRAIWILEKLVKVPV